MFWAWYLLFFLAYEPSTLTNCYRTGRVRLKLFTESSTLTIDYQVCKQSPKYLPQFCLYKDNFD
jgi:hypothetical protein